MKNFIFLLLKVFTGIITYSLIHSLFYYIKLDIINFSLNFSEFSLKNLISMMFLILFFNVFGYKFILFLISFILIEKIYILKNNKPVSYVLFFLISFIIGTIIFDSNFYINSKSINNFILSCISICFSAIIVHKFEMFINNKIKKKIN